MKKLAWSTRSRSNGFVYQWSRWHLVYNLDPLTVTLCGIGVPKAIWITGGNDYRIRGGECGECKRLNKLRYPA
jgi:hypothetical protein